MESPNHNWTLEQLAEYTQAGLSEIQKAGKHTAAQTYRIGRALYFANLKLRVVGKWTAWLEEKGIPAKTATEAIRLYQAVKDENDVADLTSTQAKTKYGIYQEPQRFHFDSPHFSGQNTLAETPSEPPKDEDKVNLAYRRLKDAAEDVDKVKKWTADLLYSTEAEECLRFCQSISQTILKQRKRIKQPKQPQGMKTYLKHLDKL